MSVYSIHLIVASPMASFSPSQFSIAVCWAFVSLPPALAMSMASWALAYFFIDSSRPVKAKPRAETPPMRPGAIETNPPRPAVSKPMDEIAGAPAMASPASIGLNTRNA